MAVRIVRRSQAARDVEELADHIANDSLAAALRFLDNAESTIRELATHPGSGSPFPTEQPGLTGLRFRRVKGFPNHLIFYREQPDSIDVIRILHGARNIDAALRGTRPEA